MVDGSRDPAKSLREIDGPTWRRDSRGSAFTEAAKIGRWINPNEDANASSGWLKAIVHAPRCRHHFIDWPARRLRMCGALSRCAAVRNDTADGGALLSALCDID